MSNGGRSVEFRILWGILSLGAGATAAAITAAFAGFSTTALGIGLGVAVVFFVARRFPAICGAVLELLLHVVGSVLGSDAP